MRIKLRLSFLFLITWLSGFSVNSDTVKIIILHPTVHNIETFIYLKENNLINIDNVKFLGVYYENEKYDYSQSIDFIKNDTAINYVSLYKVKGKIKQDDIFRTNLLTNIFDSLFLVSNGIIFTGGPDLQPSIYNSKTKLLTDITDPYRHYFEISFMYHLLGNNKTDYKPLLEKNHDYVVWAICLGMQTMNVATGGSLVQDIPSEIYGMQYFEDIINKPQLMHKNYFNKLMPNDSVFGGVLHKIKATKSEDRIYSLLNINKMPYVLSWHHQAVKELSNNLEIIFTSVDGKVVEGVAHQRFKNVYGFQFHPEYSNLYKDDVLFKEFSQSKAKSLKELLVERKSLKFHKDLWKYFSNMYK